MRTAPDKSEAEPAPSKPAHAKPPDIASASVADTLSALHVNPYTGLTHAEVRSSITMPCSNPADAPPAHTWDRPDYER